MKYLLIFLVQWKVFQQEQQQNYIREFKQQRRLPQRKRALKINIFPMVTLLRWLYLIRILTTLQMQLVGAPLNKTICVHVVVKNINLEISRCHLVDYFKEFSLSACRTCRTCSMIMSPHSSNQMIVFWRCRCLRRCHCFNSLFSFRLRRQIHEKTWRV